MVKIHELISVGSLGRNREHDTVEEVYVWNCSFTNTQNGARIKTWKVKHKDVLYFHFAPNSIAHFTCC